jgi:hypothetical protein
LPSFRLSYGPVAVQNGLMEFQPVGFYPRAHSSCLLIRVLMGVVIALGVGSVRGQQSDRTSVAALSTVQSQGETFTATLDLREPMQLAAHAIVRRLDPAEGYRPWFLLRGRGGVPVAAEHANWDLGDMTGRYLEGLILARHMGVSDPELSQAEGRLGHSLLNLLGSDGLVHDLKSGAVDHSFSQGSALYGLVTWLEDSGDPAVRQATERLITGLLRRMQPQGDHLIDPTVKLQESSGSHLTGYGIYPAARFYELTGYQDALTLAEGLTRWALSDPVLAPDGTITKALSWEGHIHSWLDTLAGCARTSRSSTNLNRQQVIARCRAVYDWVRRSNTTDFGWIATYPTGGSSETCAISSAIRLALEFVAAGHPQYLDDVERFVRNQVVEAQFKDLHAYTGAAEPPTPLLVGCFDSQSMPNGHLGTRGGEDVGTVEGCCLNGGMRAIALAWQSIMSFDESGVSVHLPITRDGPAARVIGYQPGQGRVDVIPRHPGAVRIRVPSWVKESDLGVLVDGRKAAWSLDNRYVALALVAAGARVSLSYPLRELEEDVTAGGQKFHLRWKGDVVVGVSPPGEREPTYQNRLRPAPAAASSVVNERVPDTYELDDAVRLASMSMLARLDLERGAQPFFRIYPFASPPRAEHDKWDDGDMSGRYVEALIAARRISGIPMDSRETLLRSYLANLFDAKDGLCYTRATSWTPRRACMFSQSSAMLGLLAWHAETGSSRARALLDQHVAGLMRIAVDRGTYVYFPKYEYDGVQFVDDPQGKDAPTWYGGRLILPLVSYWKLTGREDVRQFIEKLARYSIEVSQGIKPDGEVVGTGWWGHMHSTMDMAAGIVEFSRLNNHPDWIAWSKRVYDWIGRTHANRCGWVADASNSSICESCAIASRIRLGLALYYAGAADPFGEVDRYLRNQLLENQFVDLSFLGPLKPATPRTDRSTYAGIDRMVRGTFQCWGTANDLIGNPEIEGCGAGGGVQGIALAWNAQSEWRDVSGGKELRIHLLFNRRVRGPAEGGLTNGVPVALELWSDLPYQGRIRMRAHRPIAKLAVRLPDGADTDATRIHRNPSPRDAERPVSFEGPYVIVEQVQAGEGVEVVFPLREYETIEPARGDSYKVRWKGSSVLSLQPPGPKVPLYARREVLRTAPVPLCAPRYP